MNNSPEYTKNDFEALEAVQRQFAGAGDHGDVELSLPGNISHKVQELADFDACDDHDPCPVDGWDSGSDLADK